MAKLTKLVKVNESISGNRYDNGWKNPDSTLSAPMAPIKEPTTFYSVGPTDDNRINFSTGYSSITMTKLGVASLIALLQVAASHLTDEDKE